ncbi:ATP-binding protein (plasmid) [Bacillus cereus]|uniref:sensor histidine kinase n=1 Tax=Bacillus cereus TaxID=1396 RepID=UPI0001A0CE77|nr:sensor histidine kinase [Bacillus cereus]EEL61841.1 ATPase, histidine kinase-, DNA gyrase B-, and HSP90-like domain protein [Bacillus cereus F65185]PFJ63120.1 ATP-binding protein [Bacillus cereus]
MKKVSLSIDSRIISHLGEALISDEKIALLELIKNSSDADALNCNIEIDTHYKSPYGLGRIVLEDNGNGMNPYIIENAFLRIATSFKTKYQKVSPIFKREALGSKGIGRLALNQLGNYVQVETKLNTSIFQYIDNLEDNFGENEINELLKENKDFSYKFSIDWSEFSSTSAKLEDVDITLEKIKSSDSLFCGNSTHGTRIEVYGLKGISFWEHKNTKKSLAMDVLSFINPYLSKKSNFKVKINLNNEIFRSDIYDKKRIENIADVTSSFWYVSKEKKLRIQLKRHPQYIKNLIDGLVDRMDLDEFECSTANIDYQAYYDIYGEDSVEVCLTEGNIIKAMPKSDIKYLFTNEKGEYLLPGDFEGVFYGFNRQSKNAAVKSEIKNLLDNISGVKMYRNNFRIFPYGESDWLDFGTISQTQVSNIYTPNNTTGYVYINGEENLEKLKELTNREGLVQDKYGKNFLIIMQNIAKFAAYQDNKLRNELNISKVKRNKVLPGEKIYLMHGSISFIKKEDPNIIAKKNLKDTKAMIKRDFSEIKSDSKKLNPEKIIKLEETIEEKLTDFKRSLIEIENVKDKRKTQVELEKKYLSEFYPVIGATIVAETLAHEIIRISNNIKYSSLEIRSIFKKDNASIDQEWILNHLTLIDSNTKFLTRYASLLDVNSYSKRRRYEVEDLKRHIIKVFDDSPLLKYKDISVVLEIIGRGFERKIVKEGINIVFENLIINSVYWLERMKIISPTIYIEFDAENSTIRLWDNGLGIHHDISEELFEPFKTNKPNGEGRGMGLFIVRELLKEINADISLMKKRNKFGNRYVFEILFQGE